MRLVIWRHDVEYREEVNGAIQTRQNVKDVHTKVRGAILENRLPAGTVVSQVQLAEELGVSRTPLREAFRLLEHEGLLVSEVNHRMCVADLSASDFEQLYAMRIQLETLGVRLTVLRTNKCEVESLEADLMEMEACAQREDYNSWQAPHQRFHMSLVAHAGERLVRLISQLSDHAERYRHVFMTETEQGWSTSVKEHRALLEAFTRGNPDLAAERLARHYSVTVLGVLAKLSPTYDPATVRTAIRLALRK